MIDAVINELYTAELIGAPSGLAGTIGFQVTDSLGHVVTPRTRLGIVESPAGTGRYVTTQVAPGAAGTYTATWDTGVVSPSTTVNEPLVVVVGPPAATYTGVTQVQAYLDALPGGAPYTWPTDPDAQLNLILQAERDIDVLGASRPMDSTTGRRFAPVANLTANQLQALQNAVAAQVEYILVMGPELFSQPQFSSVSGPDFTTQGKRPVVGPKARRELALAGGLIRFGGRAHA